MGQARLPDAASQCPVFGYAGVLSGFTPSATIAPNNVPKLPSPRVQSLSALPTASLPTVLGVGVKVF